MVTTPPHYPGWTVRASFGNRYTAEKRDGAKVFRCPMLLRANMGGLARMLAPLSFALTSAPVAIARALVRRPNVVVATEPGLFAAPAALDGGAASAARRPSFTCRIWKWRRPLRWAISAAAACVHWRARSTVQCYAGSTRS